MPSYILLYESTDLEYQIGLKKMLGFKIMQLVVIHERKCSRYTLCSMQTDVKTNFPIILMFVRSQPGAKENILATLGLWCAR